jgi:hypothetical protein
VLIVVLLRAGSVMVRRRGRRLGDLEERALEVAGVRRELAQPDALLAEQPGEVRRVVDPAPRRPDGDAVVGQPVHVVARLAQHGVGRVGVVDGDRDRAGGVRGQHLVDRPRDQAPAARHDRHPVAHLLHLAEQVR